MPSSSVCLGSTSLKLLAMLLLLRDLALQVCKGVCRRLGRWLALTLGQLSVIICKIPPIHLPDAFQATTLHRQELHFEIKVQPWASAKAMSLLARHSSH